MSKKVYIVLLLLVSWLLPLLSYAQQVMLQGWYWDYPKTGQGYNWSDTLRLKATALSQSGFTHVWYPPFAGNGNKSGGYDPKDLFVGPAQTSLGTLGEIKTMVSSFTAVGITPVADMVYNHRDAGAPESNPAVKDYITKFSGEQSGECGFKRPFPSDRYRMVIPLGGLLPNGVPLGKGKYYIKIRSRNNIFDNYRYVFHATTGKLGGSRWNPNKSEEVDLTAGFSNPRAVELGRNYLNRLWQFAANDEFEVTVTDSDFNAAGDQLILEAINLNGNYSNHLPIQIYYLPQGSGTSYNIANINDPFNEWYKLDFQTYTNFNNMPSGRGALDWKGFRPHFTSSSRAGWSQTTCLGPEWSMQSLDYFYDYDHNIPATRDLLIDWTKWTYDELGSKGLRMDAIKHFEPSFVSTMLNQMVASNRTPNMVVGEWYGENPDELKNWVDAVSNGLDQQTRQAVPVKVFDFSLRRALKDALDNGANARQVFFSSLRDARGMSGFNVVTFLNNHDFRSSNTSFGDALVHNNPILGYAYLLTNNQLGVPAVFYPDYYGYPARNSKFGTDTYGFDYHPVGLKPMKKEIDQLMKVLQTYIINSPGVDYLNHYGGTANGPQAPTNYLEGDYNRCLLYQLRAPGQTGKEVIVAINFGNTRLRVDHLIAVRNGIAPGTRLLDVLGNSAYPYAVVDNQNRIYVELPPRSYSVWVQDIAPLSATLAIAPNSGTICPGQSATLTTTATGGTAPYTYVFSAGATPTQSSSVATATTSGPYSVTVTDALGLTAVASVTLAVQAPTTITQEPASGSAVCVGTPVSVSVAVTGPGTLGYQWYKSSTHAPVAGQTTATFSLSSAQPSDAGGYYGVVTSACTSLTSTVFNLTVNNPPVATLLAGNNGKLTCAQPSLLLTAGGGERYLFTGPDLNQQGVANTTTVTRPGGYSVTVTDGNGCVATAQTTVEAIDLPAPVIQAVTGPLSPQLIGTSVSLTATITGDLAGATWQWQWGNGTTSGGMVTNNTLVTAYTYSAQGVYSPTLVISGACNQTVIATHQYVVLYNPDGGFVTGGGWINSPKGAFKANPELFGKATFGFVAKYRKGSTVPDGNTEFQFKAGDLNFKSTAYDDMRLVIAGARANYKGMGTINGTGSFRFLVSAIDGQVNGGGGVDKFRIKIWNSATDQVVYDNNLAPGSLGDDAEPETAIGGGSIVIHSDKGKREAAEPALPANAMVLRNYPNPITDRTTIEFMLPQGGDYSLEIQDLKGSLVRRLQAGRAEAGQSYQVLWDAGNLPGGLYLTRLMTQQGVKVIKMLVR
ncbi:hypothetical protein GCM10023187_00640 [Nibrella viscosa]|uniref:Por secretion system C-terminal sorting domain-containing protein n=1 Tax=Nibrella viscosa TaxID=1084524 RepID=A0ABP8JQW9_9BACT